MQPTNVFKASPKTGTVLMYDREFFITLHPRQKWNVKEFVINGVKSYTASWNCVRINFTQTRFNMLFKKVKD